MARLFVTSINLNKNELQNARIQNLSSAPSSPVAGQIYFDTSTNIMYFYNGTAWIPTSGSTEVIQDTISQTLVAGEGIDLTYDDNAGTLTVDAEIASHSNRGVASFNDTDFTVTDGNVTLNAERVEDIVGGMVSTNNETLISVTYDDINGKLDFSVTDQFSTNTTTNLTEGTNLYYTAERVQDEINNTVIAGTGLDKTYDDGAGTFTLDIDSTVTTNSGSQTLTNKTLGSGNALGANLDAANYKIINLGTPTASGDAVNKSYVDGLTAGLDWKAAVNLLADSNIALSGTSGTLVIDGHTVLDSGDDGYRILLKGQDTDSENGIYVYNDAGLGYTLTRATDADAYGELLGAAVFVMEGTTYGSTSWIQSNHYLVDFTGQTWTQFSGAGTYLAGAGLNLNGNTFSVDTTPISGNASIKTDNGATEVKTDTSRGLSVDSNGLGVNAGTGLTFNTGALTFASGYGVRKFAANIGDNSATSIDVTHSFGTKDVTVHIYDNSSPYAQIEADVEHANNNYVTIKFASAPTTDQYRVVVVG